MRLTESRRELDADPARVRRMHLSGNVNRQSGTSGGIDRGVRPLDFREASNEADVVARPRTVLVLCRIQTVMDDRDVRERHFAPSLILGDGDVLRIRVEAVEGRQLLVPHMMDGVNQRHVRNESRARQRHCRVRVDKVEVTALAHLLHCPRSVVHVRKRFRRPQRLGIEKAKLGRGPRIAGSEQLDVMAAFDQPLRQLVHDQLGAAVAPGWNGQKWSGDQCNSHDRANLHESYE